MGTEPLVVCSECGRPQYRQSETCLKCGAPLPMPVPVGEVSGRDKVLQAFEPFFEADLGNGRVLTLSERRLEWALRRGGPATQFELSSIRSVELHRRPAFEALLFWAPAAGVFGWVREWPPRIAVLALAIWAAASCFMQRRYALRVHGPGGTTELVLGVGRYGSAHVFRVRGVWESLSQELRSLGVTIQEQRIQ